MAAGNSCWRADTRRISFLRCKAGQEIVMRKISRFENGVAACLLSWLIASAICASANPAISDSARVIANSVNRSGKTDRLVITQQAARNSVPAKNTTPSKRTPVGCEAAFSPFANPGRPDVLNYCVT